MRKLLREAFTDNFELLPNNPTTILCLASRGTKEPTFSYSTGIATKSITTIPVGPNASSLKLLELVRIL
ncbi:31396_t:CDS:2 [Gigaspora margarita]|uniref:31396_t:CDS:1 n=1 Tax=Gigaspora margarita TaxID=4874 RepID=A0ABN7UVB6_GIGMA|nr:31396_t:CDS:2 [Gigaspora margarita]